MSELISGWNSLAELWWSGIVRASIQGGIALLAVWALVRAVPRLSPRIRCWLWRLAYLKLFLALAWGRPVELPLLPAPTPDTPVMIGITAERSVLAGLSQPTAAPDLSPGPAAGPATPTRRAHEARGTASATPLAFTGLSPAGWAFLGWLTGVAWCIQRIGAACRAARKLRDRTRPVECADLRSSCDVLARKLALLRSPEVASSGEVEGPLLLGGRPAAIVLPEDMAARPAQELQLILAHELAHLSRGDLRWNWLPAAAHTLFFFHPLVWIAGGEWRLCQEMACDELALGTTRAGAGDYGEMLLKVAAAAGRHPRWGWTTAGAATQFLGAAWSDDSPDVLRRRIQMLRYYRSDTTRSRKPGMWSHTSMTGVVIAAAGLCLVPWRVTAQDATETEVPVSTAGPKTVIQHAEDAPTLETPAGEPVLPSSAAGEPESSPTTGALDPTPGQPAALPGATDRGALSEQWEDVLLLEAMRYLGLTVAQSREAYPLSGTAQRRLKELAEQDRRVEAALARIARQSRDALLAGQPGTGHKEALELEDVRRRKRARGEEELLDFIVPRLANLLTREQIIRACLLTIGEPPQEQGRTISPALLNPEAGFVLGAPVVAQPSTTLRDQVNERLGTVRSRWDERRQAAARKELSARYPQKIVDAIMQNRNFGIVFTNDLTLTVAKISDGISLDYLITSPKAVFDAKTGERQPENPEVAAARKEWDALMARTEVPLSQLLLNEATPDELRLGLRAFTRRMFLSPRLRPVLDARLRLR